MLTYVLLAAVDDGPNHFQVVKHEFTTRSEAISAALAYVRDPCHEPFMVEVEDSEGRPLFTWDPNGDYLAEAHYTDAQWYPETVPPLTPEQEKLCGEAEAAFAALLG